MSKNISTVSKLFYDNEWQWEPPALLWKQAVTDDNSPDYKIQRPILIRRCCELKTQTEAKNSIYHTNCLQCIYEISNLKIQMNTIITYI